MKLERKENMWARLDSGRPPSTDILKGSFKHIVQPGLSSPPNVLYLTLSLVEGGNLKRVLGPFRRMRFITLSFREKELKSKSQVFPN